MEGRKRGGWIGSDNGNFGKTFLDVRFDVLVCKQRISKVDMYKLYAKLLKRSCKRVEYVLSAQWLPRPREPRRCRSRRSNSRTPNRFIRGCSGSPGVHRHYQLSISLIQLPSHVNTQLHFLLPSLSLPHTHTLPLTVLALLLCLFPLCIQLHERYCIYISHLYTSSVYTRCTYNGRQRHVRHDVYASQIWLLIGNQYPRDSSIIQRGSVSLCIVSTTRCTLHPDTICMCTGTPNPWHPRRTHVGMQTLKIHRDHCFSGSYTLRDCAIIFR